MERVSETFENLMVKEYNLTGNTGVGGRYKVKEGFICFNDMFQNMVAHLRERNQERRRGSLD